MDMLLSKDCEFCSIFRYTISSLGLSHHLQKLNMMSRFIEKITKRHLFC